MTKNITIIPALGGEFKDIQIQPGTTARDVKAQLGLPDNYVLTRGKDSDVIDNDENLYETTNDGAKLYSTTNVRFG